MYVLIEDDRAGLALRRLRPWHRLLAQCQAGRLDRELAGGASPEASATLAARAMRLTSLGYRRDLAASLRRIVLAAGEPEAIRSVKIAAPNSSDAARPPRVPLRRARISQSGRPPRVPLRRARISQSGRPPRVPLSHTRISQSSRLLAELASRLAAPGPVPVGGVAIVTRLLSEGMGPLYREASRDDLGLIAERAAQALTL